MGKTSLADTKYCVPLRLHSQGDVRKSLGGGNGHGNSLSRAEAESGSFFTHSLVYTSMEVAWRYQRPENAIPICHHCTETLDLLRNRTMQIDVACGVRASKPFGCGIGQ